MPDEFGNKTGKYVFLEDDGEIPDRRIGDRREGGWQLEKTISIGHIITTITVACSVIVWAMHMETRIALVEQETVNGARNDTRIEKLVGDSVGRVEAALLRIEMKLDHKADKK